MTNYMLPVCLSPISSRRRIPVITIIKRWSKLRSVASHFSASPSPETRRSEPAHSFTQVTTAPAGVINLDTQTPEPMPKRYLGAAPKLAF